MNKEEQMP